MSDLNFEWDRTKAAVNRQKHGISFEEAKSSFDDPNRLIEFDEGHSEGEDRWLLTGLSERLRLLVVSYTKRNENIRIISARRANQAAKSRYTGEA